MAVNAERSNWRRSPWARILATVLTTIVIASVSATAAFAASYYGTWRDTGSYASENYQNRSHGVTRTADFSWYTTASTRTTGNACTGCMGAQVRGYASNGQLLIASSWQYNSAVASSMTRGVSENDACCQFYSKGKTKYWNGDTYSGEWNSNASPTWRWG